MAYIWAMTEPEIPNNNDALLEVVDAMDLVAGIPVPPAVKQNALKAFGRLCTSAVDIVVADWEGRAAERRAESAARVSAIVATGGQMVDALRVDPKYASAIANKYGERIVRQRRNVDAIAEVAAAELKAHPPTTAGSAQISDDWLNSFESEAEKMSSDEMRLHFGKILAGEIKAPGTFSAKTVRLVAQIDPHTAAIFYDFCRCAVSMQLPGNDIRDARVVAVSGTAGSNALQQFGLTFDNLNKLIEFGLIITDLNSHFPYGWSILRENRVAWPFTYQRKYWVLEPGQGASLEKIAIHGVAVSKSGAELFSIIDAHPNIEYEGALRTYFAGQNYTMREFIAPMNSVAATQN